MAPSGSDLATRPDGDAATGLRGVVQLVLAVLVAAGAFLALPHHDASGAGTGATQAVVAPSGPVPIEDFCRSFVALQTALGAFAGLETTSVSDIHEAALDVQRLAPGTVMPPDASAGLTYLLGLILALDESAKPGDLMSSDTGASLRDSANAAAFSTWQNDACPVR